MRHVFLLFTSFGLWVTAAEGLGRPQRPAFRGRRSRRPSSGSAWRSPGLRSGRPSSPRCRRRLPLPEAGLRRCRIPQLSLIHIFADVPAFVEFHEAPCACNPVCVLLRLQHRLIPAAGRPPERHLPSSAMPKHSVKNTWQSRSYFSHTSSSASSMRRASGRDSHTARAFTIMRRFLCGRRNCCAYSTS